MQNRGFTAVLIGVILLAGCAGAPKRGAFFHHPNTPRYPWLRKQGLVAAQQHEPRIRPARARPIAAKDRMRPLPIREAVPQVPDAPDPRMTAQRSGPTGPAVFPIATPAATGALTTVPRVVAQQDTGDYYQPPPGRWNAKAIASLPVALTAAIWGIAVQSLPLLLIGGAVAFTLALVGARQCRNRRERGRGFALAAMIVGGGILFFALMAYIS